MKSIYTLNSATPNMYATIPMWALRTKKPIDILRCKKYKSNKYIDVDVTELKKLIAERKIWVSIHDTTGDQYITSKIWTKYFS